MKMKLSGKNLFKKLTFQIVIAIISSSLLLAIGFYTFLLRPFTENMAKQIVLNMQEHARDIYSICDQSDMEIIRLGVTGDDPVIKVRKGYAIGRIENFMLRTNIIVIITKDNDIILRPDLMTDSDVVTVQKAVKPGSQLLSLITHEGKQYYTHTSYFDPWNWKIIIMESAGAYKAVKQGITTFYSATGFFLILGALLLLYYFNRVITVPLHGIISKIQQGSKPDYRGIEEFEYLSNNLRNTLEQTELDTIEIEKVNASLKKEIEERKKADELIHAQRDMGIALSGVRDMKEALTLLLDLAIALEDMDCGGIYLINRVSGAIDLVCHKGLSKCFVSKTSHYDEDTENVRLIMDGKPMYVDYSKLPIAKTDRENKEGLSSIAIIPILYHGQVIACMNISSFTANVISSTTISSLETIASQIGRVIARLLAEEALNKANEKIEVWNRELQKRIEEKTDELVKSQAQLIQSEKLAAMGEMAGGLAHELNSPIAGLLPMIEKYKDDAKKGSREYKELSLMLKACNHMAKIVKDFGSFSRESKAEFYKLNLNLVIEDTLSFIAGRIMQKRVQLIKEYDRKLPKIQGEKTGLQQVILNIITNALDAVDIGGILTIKTGIADNENVKVEFIDNGAGIENEIVKKIFDPFYTTKRPGKGTGLGLSVSYKIIEKHGGKISVESEPGKGTKFTILLPVAK